MSIVTDARTESAEQLLEGSDEFELEELLTDVNRHYEAQAEQRPAAVACGVSGCRNNEDLAHIQIEGFGQRVLCPLHLIKLVWREIEKPDEEDP